MSEWLPIESAPKDGTFIILYASHNEPPVSIGYYEDDGELWAGAASQVWWMVEADIMPSACRPTHWMPLPKPPEAQ